MPADRARRQRTWAAAVTPDTPTPSSPHPGSAHPGSAHPGPGWDTVPLGTAGDRRVASAAGAGLAEIARRELGQLLSAGREAVLDRLAEVAQGDPARKHAKRLRRARRRLHAQATAATGVAGLTAVAVAASAPEIAEVGLGTGAVLLGAAAVRAGRRLADLRRQPLPPRRTARPPKDSPARAPLDRLSSQEQTLHALLLHLGEAAAEPRRVAAGAAAGLRDLGARLTAVHRAHRLSGGLEDAVAALRQQLDAGLLAYDALVVAAADAVAADAGLRGPGPSLREATDALAGLAAGLRAVA